MLADRLAGWVRPSETMPRWTSRPAGLLDGLEGDQRAARERLLERLVDAGFDAEELEAVAEEPPRAVAGGPPARRRYTAREVEQRTGFPAAQMLRIRRLLGLPEADPDDPVFSDEDIEAARVDEAVPGRRLR